MRTRKSRLVLAALLGVAALYPVSVQAAALVLVENGVSRAPIVVFEGAPPFTRRAADELAYYLEKTTGARPPVLEGRPDPLPERAIWVGCQPVLSELFPGIDFEFQHPEEILIAANENHLVIAGRDRWDPDHLVVPDRRGRPIVGKQQEYGTVNAIYTFLQDCLGVRWLWPGDLGEDVLKTDTVSFAPFTYRYHPQIRGRGGVFAFSALGNAGYGRSHDWTRFQRLQLDSLEFGGGHGLADWWERFHETHPEYFALQPDGTRSGWPGPRTVKMCHSNPAVAEQWLADVEAQLAQDPNRTVFSASPNDGWSSGHCICDNCRAWDDPGAEPRRHNWQGLAQDYVALSDREVNFANRCARLLRERYPDKDYHVLTMAYGLSRPVPVAAMPDDNVIISSVANFFGRRDEVDRASPRGETHREQFAAWGRVAPQLIWRPNISSLAGWHQAQPDIWLSGMIEDFRFAAELGTIGLFIDTVWEHWATQGPQYYLMAQLAWNPYQDGQAVLDDYYRRGFEPAAGELGAYWLLLEKTRETFIAGGRAYPEVYDRAFFDQAYGYLDRAAEKTIGAPKTYGERVKFVRAGLDYTRLVVDTRAQMALVRVSQGTDKEADGKARANWAEMERIGRDYPYAVNWGPLQPGGDRMKALNPDYYR